MWSCVTAQPEIKAEGYKGKKQNRLNLWSDDDKDLLGEKWIANCSHC